MSAMAQLMALQTEQGDPYNFIPNVLPPDAFPVYFLFCIFFPMVIHGWCLVRNALWQWFPWADGDKPKVNSFLPSSELSSSSFHHTPSLWSPCVLTLVPSISKEIPDNWMPRAELLAEIICWQCRAASCCKHQVFRQEETSLAFMGVLDQPLAFGCLSCVLSASFPGGEALTWLPVLCVTGELH